MQIVIKNVLLLLICTIGWGVLCAQGHFSAIIERDSINLSVGGLSQKGDKFLIPIIYPGETSSLIVYQPSTDKDTFYHYERFKYSENSAIQIGNQLYFYAKDRTQLKGLQLGKMNEDFELEWRKPIPTNGFYNFPYMPLSIGDKIYLSGTIENNNQNEKYHFISRRDSLGDPEWTRYYNQDYSYSVPATLLEAPDGNLVLSLTVTPPDSMRRHSQTTKLDGEGNIIWEYNNPDVLSSLAPWMTLLSDSTIVQAYKMFQPNNPYFGLNDYNDRPYRLMWLDQEGNRLRDQWITFDQYQTIQLSNLKASEDDMGFYAMGNWEGGGEVRNLLIKFDNAGDTIWARTYEHPTYPAEDNYYSIKDLVELEDGKIVILSSISSGTDYNKAWLYTVNEYGCFEGTECSEHQVITSTTPPPLESKDNIRIYPNPTSGSVIIEHQKGQALGELRLYDSRGVLDKSWTRPTPRTQLELGDRPPGLYFLQIELSNGAREVKKVIIQP